MYYGDLSVSLTHADICGNTANVDICDSSLIQFRSHFCLTQFLVVEKAGVGIDVTLRSFVYHNTVFGNLKEDG